MDQDQEEQQDLDEFDLRPEDQKRDYNRINATIWVRNMFHSFKLFSMIFGCAFFFGMAFRTVITFTVIDFSKPLPTEEARLLQELP